MKYITLALILFAVPIMLACRPIAAEATGEITSVDRDVVSKALEIIGSSKDTLDESQINSLHALGLSDDDIEMLITVFNTENSGKNTVLPVILSIAAVIIASVIVCIILKKRKIANSSS